eukprot:12508302-Alexandrium_andersonii.AAC.1
MHETDKQRPPNLSRAPLDLPALAPFRRLTLAAAAVGGRPSWRRAASRDVGSNPNALTPRVVSSTVPRA